MISNKTYQGFVGTYTKGNSKGIYTFTLDIEARKITRVRVAAQLDNPTYLSVTNDNQYLYSVIQQGDAGGIAAFSIDGQTRQLTQINHQLLPGAQPCHVGVDNKKHLLFSSNYHKGEVVSYPFHPENGSLHPPVSIIKHESSGPNKAHIHFAAVTPDEKYLAVVDLGSDALVTYELSKEGKLTEVNQLAFHPGTGPRHLTFHPKKNLAYIMTEFSSEVIALAYHPESGHFTEIQKISTIPADFSEKNQGSAIHISSDGRFIYAGNRGHNSIAVFSVDHETGKLAFIELVSSEGDWPRDFMLDPTETLLLASNQESDNLVLYARDPHTGRLTLIQSDVTVPSPVCIKFLHQ